MKKNIDNTNKKKQNLKCKAILASIIKLSKTKKKKKLNNMPAETLDKKVDIANNQS